MNTDFSKTENPIPTISVALSCVYILNADASYDIRKNLKDNKDIIALRTIGGEGRVKIEGIDEISVLPGTLLFFEHCMVRRYQCIGDTWDFWWFEFTSSGVFNQPLNKLILPDYEVSEEEAYKTCFELLRKSDSSSRLLASSVFSHVLCKWMVSLKKNTAGNPHQPAIDLAIDHMRSSLPEKVSIKGLAAAAGLSERRFREVFENITGMQPKRYYDAMRISIAVELLRNTSFTIAEISDRLGYSSQFHFTRVFEKAHSVAPLHFRKSNM